MTSDSCDLLSLWLIFGFNLFFWRWLPALISCYRQLSTTHNAPNFGQLINQITIFALLWTKDIYSMSVEDNNDPHRWCPSPGIDDYIMLHAKRNSGRWLTDLEMWRMFWVTGWAHCNHRSLSRKRGKQESQCQRDSLWGRLDQPLLTLMMMAARSQEIQTARSFSLRATRKKCCPPGTVISVQGHPFQISDLPNCKTINLCCLKLLSWGRFVQQW